MTIEPQHSRYRKPPRCGLSLLELVIAMGLLAIIMVPVVGLLATSYKIYNSQSDAADSNYTRTSALDAVSLRLRTATRVVDFDDQRLELLLPNGTPVQLEFVRGGLFWHQSNYRQLIANGLSNARFFVTTARGADTTAGQIVGVELATRGANQPRDVWSRTKVWVRPTI